MNEHDLLALTNLAIFHSEQGQLDEAENYFRAALLGQPQQASAHYNLGLLLMERGLATQALSCFRQAVALNPNHANAYRNLALILLEQKELTEAAQRFQELLRIQPDDTGAFNNLGNIFKEQSRLTEAIACYRKALAIDPLQVTIHYNLGLALREHGLTEEALACCREALRLDPQHARSHHHLGDILRDQGLSADALACYHEALRYDPNHADTYNNLASVLFKEGIFAQAMVAYQQAVRLNPELAIARFNLAILWLMAGALEKGWPEYEFRFKEPSNPPRIFTQPRWDGTPLAGNTILLYAEQGLGDTIHFIRYADLVRRQGGTVIFECPLPLLSLLEKVSGIDRIVPVGQPLPAFDVQAPLLSLPGIIKTMLANIPATIPYLQAKPELIRHWRQKLPPSEDLTIGIAWQGSTNHVTDELRSLPLAQFEPLARVKGVQLVSLQIGPETRQLMNAPFPVLDLGNQFDITNLEDLAAVIKIVDLVVTVDTAVAHLAGALGVPVWTLLPFVPDWRWLLERTDSPWYPTMRLFRQIRLGDWHEVFERLAASLAQVRRTGIA